MKMLSEEKVKIVNGNIPMAVRAADKHVKDNPTGNKFQDDTAWNEIYHSTMDTLCKNDGVRV